MAAPALWSYYRRCLALLSGGAARLPVWFCCIVALLRRRGCSLAAVDGCEARAAANAWSWLLPKQAATSLHSPVVLLAAASKRGAAACARAGKNLRTVILAAFANYSGH